jgi:hypothetical protein
MRVCKIGVQSTLDMSHQYFVLEYRLLNVLVDIQGALPKWLMGCTRIHYSPCIGLWPRRFKSCRRRTFFLPEMRVLSVGFDFHWSAGHVTCFLSPHLLPTDKQHPSNRKENVIVVESPRCETPKSTS